MTITVLYGVACVLAFALIVIYIGFFKEKDIWILMTFISLILCNLGHLARSVSAGLGEALLANRIIYLGNVFLPLFLFMTIMKVCRFKYSDRLPYILTFISAAMLVVTLSPGYLDIYYKSVSFAVIDGSGTLLKEYGALHQAYYIYLMLYFIAMIGIIGRSFFKKKVVSYKHALYLAAAVLLNIGIYFLERFTDIEFELLTFSYLVTALFLLSICKALEHYDVARVLKNTLETDNTGIILFDADGNYKGCNDDAALLFDELNNLKLEYPIPPYEHILQAAIIPVLSGREAEQGTTFRKNDRIYRITRKPIYRNRTKSDRLPGTAVIISDDTKQQEYLELISTYNETLEAEVADKTKHVIKMHDNLIRGMADMVEGRDPNTGGHIKRTSTVVGIFVKRLWELGYPGVNEVYLKNVAKAAPMHDLGKIAIDDAILRKPGKYTPGEYSVMQTHAAKGAKIVGKVLSRADDEEFYDIAVNVAHYHHEKYDGTGYPERLAGESIPVEARIMALADVFDALVSKRCYKDEYSCEEAFRIIRDSLGKQFDPDLGELFLACSEELTETMAAAQI